jgi:hypothetical protein
VLIFEVASIARFTYLPEVLDHRVTLSVAAVVSVLLPVVDIDVCYATNEELEFTFVKDVDKIRRDELVEALHKGIELFVDPLLNAPLCYEPGKPVSTFNPRRLWSRETYSTYSFLFSFVTSMSLPPSFRSTITFSPNRSSSTEKVE